MKAAILVALISFLGCSVAAQAHQINLTNARLVVLPDRTVDVEIAMKGSDADRAAGTKVFDDAAGLVQPAALPPCPLTRSGLGLDASDTQSGVAVS